MRDQRRAVLYLDRVEGPGETRDRGRGPGLAGQVDELSLPVHRLQSVDSRAGVGQIWNSQFC